MPTLRMPMSNISLTSLTALLLLYSRCYATTLQFSQTSDRPLALYRAPAPYQEAGKARLNSVIITSRPFAIAEQLNVTSRSNADHITTEEPFWRRHLFVTSHHTTSTSTTTDHPRSSSHMSHVSIDCTNGKSCSETININSTPSPTFKPYSKDVLDKFLSDYAKVNSIKPPSKNETPTSTARSNTSNNKNSNENKNKDMTEDDTSIEPANRLANLYLDEEDDPDSPDSKSRPHWSLIQAQHHNHPYDDRDGWVTLEAIPWSSSKVSKWHSSNIGNKRPPWPTYTKPSNHWDNRPSSHDWNSEKPHKPWERPQYGDRPTDWNYEKPIKPQYLISNRPVNDHWSQETTHRPVLHLERPVSDYNYKPPHGHHQQWITSNHPDIITEGTPENWPLSVNRPGSTGSFKPWPSPEPEYHHPHNSYDDDYKYESNRRPPTPVVYHEGIHPQSHPDSGEGEWVLLSSTKGYSLPVRHHSYQRALTFNSKPITSTRTVKLTVLPALNGTTNTTTSHGGLLEVESTFQSVEEAQRDDAKKKIEHDALNDTKAEPVRLVARPMRKRGSGRAVLAAVGAGMLPATMALLVPMMLGRKKRSTIVPNGQVTTPMPATAKYNSPRVNSGRENGKLWRGKKSMLRRNSFVKQIKNESSK